MGIITGDARWRSRMKDDRQFFISLRAGFILIGIGLSLVLMLTAESRAQGQKRDLIITTLYDNHSSRQDLKTGWGFACLIQGPEKTILFDVGSPDAVDNMDQLGIDAASIDVLVISHAHPDHTGGRRVFAERNKRAAVYDVPNDPVKICENVFTTGAMTTSVRERNAFLQGIVENALMIRTAKGLVILTGCAHPGIVEIVQKAKGMFPGDAVYLVLGGFHLMDFSRFDVAEIANDLKKEKVRRIVPGHCTGAAAESVFQKVFGSDCMIGVVGKPIVIEDAFAP